MIPGFTKAQIKEEEKRKDDHHDEKTKSSCLQKSSWAKLLARVFQIDILRCIHCDGELRILSSIKDPDVVQKILVSLREPCVDF